MVCVVFRSLVQQVRLPDLIFSLLMECFKLLRRSLVFHLLCVWASESISPGCKVAQLQKDE